MKNKIIYILIIIGICMPPFYNTVIGQIPYVKHFTSDDGLAHDIAFNVMQDQQGFIWFATDDGISRFDGTSFKTFKKGLNTSYVIDIEEDVDSTKVLATWGAGVHLLKGDSIYKPDWTEDEEQKIDRVYKISDGRFVSNFVGSGFAILDLKRKSKVLYVTDPIPSGGLGLNQSVPPMTVMKRIKSIDHELFLFSISDPTSYKSQYDGLYRFDEHAKNKLTPFAKKLMDKKVHEVFKEKTEYYVTSFDSIYLYRDRILRQSWGIPEVKGHTIYKLVCKDGIFYFISLNPKTGKRDLYQYTLSSKTLVNLSKEIGIQNFVTDILFDRQQNLWMTTQGEGVYMIPKKRTVFYGEESFENLNILKVLGYQDQLFALSMTNLYRISNQKITNYSLPYSAADLQLDTLKKELKIKTFSLHGNFKKIGDLHTKFGMRRFQLVHGEFTVDNMIYQKPNVLNIYRNDRHIAAIDDKKDWPLSMCIKDAILYVVRDEFTKGVYRYDLATGKSLKDWNTENGFPSVEIHKMQKIGEEIWFATERGLWMFDGTCISKIREEEGLINNHVTDFLIDQHGIFWIATLGGLHVSVNGHIYSIDKEQGQYSSSVKSITEHNDFIYVAGNKGLFRWDNSVPFSPASSTKLVIDQQQEKFRIHPLNYNTAQSINIRYQLNNEPFQDIKTDELDFKYQPHGKHTLQLMYRDATSNWQFSKQYHFKVYHPWYERPWFLMLLVSCVSMLIIIWSVQRLKKSKQKNKILQDTLQEREQLKEELYKVRQNVAQDFHDELGNTLASISVLSNLMQQKANPNDEQYSKIQKINQDADTLYSGMRDFIWTLDNKSDQLIELQLYLKDFGEQLFANSEIKFYSAAFLQEKECILPYYWNKQLVFIFKEAMTNCLKYSKAAKANLSFELIEDTLLKIQFSDNGIGFDQKQLKRINGLNNMERRAQRIKGTLDIKSSDNGTSIIFMGNFSVK